MGDDAIRMLQERIRDLQVSIDAMRRENNEAMRELRERIDELKDDYNMRVAKIEKRCALRQHVVDAHEKFVGAHGAAGADDWLNARIGRWFIGLATTAIGAVIGALARGWLA